MIEGRCSHCRAVYAMIDALESSRTFCPRCGGDVRRDASSATPREPGPPGLRPRVQVVHFEARPKPAPSVSSPPLELEVELTETAPPPPPSSSSAEPAAEPLDAMPLGSLAWGNPAQPRGKLGRIVPGLVLVVAVGGLGAGLGFLPLGGPVLEVSPPAAEMSQPAAAPSPTPAPAPTNPPTPPAPATVSAAPVQPIVPSEGAAAESAKRLHLSRIVRVPVRRPEPRPAPHSEDGPPTSDALNRQELLREAQRLQRAGFERLGQGEVSEALSVFRRAVTLQPDLAPAHRGLGAALSAQGELAEAASAYRQYLSLVPGAEDAAEVEALIDQLQ